MNFRPSTAPRRHSLVLSLVLVAGALANLSACAPLLVGGAVMGGTLMYADRRTSGTQIEDQAIEIKAASRIRETLGDRIHINVTSYNRQVLLTGEALTDADKATAEQVAQRVENVRNVVNELGVMGASSLTSRSSDTILSGKVKASLVDAKDLLSNAFKVVTEREANRASDVARSVSGVQRVVRVFELISEAELAELLPKPSPK